MNATVAGLAGLSVALVVTPLAAKVARRFRLVDRPGPLKIHASPTPYLGGIAISLGATAGLAAARPLWMLPLLAAVALGTADDVRPLSPWKRLAGQLVVGSMVAWLVATRLPAPGGDVFVVMATVVLMNGFNLIDGLDALASGVALVSFLFFALLLQGSGAVLAASLAGAVAGFFVFNRPPARIFLGDGGSYLLGAGAALLLAQSWGSRTAVGLSVACLALVAVPVIEVVFATLRRALSPGSVLLGDRHHPYDRLVAQGWSPEMATLWYVLAQAVLGTIALAARSLTGPLAAVIVAFAAVAIVLTAARAGLITRTIPDTAVDER